MKNKVGTGRPVPSKKDKSMKKTMVRALALLLTVCLSLGIVSCNGASGKTEGSKGQINVEIPSESGDEESFEGSCPIPEDEEQLRAFVSASKNYESSYLSGRDTKEVACYVADDRAIFIRKVSFGFGPDKVTAYVADIYLSDIRDLIGCVLFDEEGAISKGTPEDVMNTVEDALFIVNTDFMRSRSWGLYVRGGKVYRSKPTAGIDICAIGKDGKMEILDGDTLDPEQLMEEGNVWHVLTFGPSLLNEDGTPRDHNSEFRINDNYSRHDEDETVSSVGFLAPNPRTAIGQAEDGHYILVSVDGRDKWYSRGMRFPELSHLMYEEGASVAYNLDGGGSVFMYYDGKPVNSNTGGRSPSDYFVILKKEN